MFCRHTKHRPRQGAAAAELAILLPVLLLLMLAVVDFARIAHASITITNCAENGALYACDPATQNQSSYANTTAAAQADGTNLSPLPTVDVRYDSAHNGSFTSTAIISPGYVQVTASWTFTALVDYSAFGIPYTTTLTRSVRMRMLSE